MCTFLIISTKAVAVIPVTDGASIAQTASEYLQTATRWKEQVQQYEQDYKNQMQQLAAQTGITDIAQLVNQTQDAYGSLKDIEGYLSNPQAILSSGYDALTPELKSTYQSYHLDNLCNQYKDDKQLKNCQGKIVINALRQVRNEKAMNQVEQHYSKIQEIADKMVKAQTQKESTDYQNALQVQLALLQADKTAIDIQQNNDTQIQALQSDQKENSFHERLKKEMNSATFDKSWGAN